MNQGGVGERNHVFWEFFVLFNFGKAYVFLRRNFHVAFFFSPQGDYRISMQPQCPPPLLSSNPLPE